MSESQRKSQDKVELEIAEVKQNIAEVKEMLQQSKAVAASKRSGRKGLFSRPRQTIPVEIQPEPTIKAPIGLDELLPLLPQLGGMIPQLNNPKVAETLKILSNPAIAGMIRQFISTSGGKTKGNEVVPLKKKRA